MAALVKFCRAARVRYRPVLLPVSVPEPVLPLAGGVWVLVLPGVLS